MITDCLFDNCSGAVQQASIQTGFNEGKIVHIWQTFIMAFFCSVRRQVQITSEEANRVFVPWLHPTDIDRCKEPANTWGRDFQLVFWARFGNPGWPTPEAHDEPGGVLMLIARMQEIGLLACMGRGSTSFM